MKKQPTSQLHRGSARNNSKIAIVLFLCIILATCLIGCEKQPFESREPFRLDWMSSISDSAKIKDIAIPGTHDAGTHGMVSFAETQNTTIYEQLTLGVRYFDIRVSKSGKNLSIFHSVVKGMKFSVVLDDIKRFASEQPTEIFILDFQHFENGAESAVADLLKTELSADTTALPATEDIANITLGDMRSRGYRYIIPWGGDVPEHTPYVITRQNVLRSPYRGEEHKKGAEHLVATFPNYYAENDGTTLFVLQSQLTPNGLESQKSLEEKFRGVGNEFLRGLIDQKNSATLAKTNIVMRDFIDTNQNTIRFILNLNVYKNLVKADKVDNFKYYTQHINL